MTIEKIEFSGNEPVPKVLAPALLRGAFVSPLMIALLNQHKIKVEQEIIPLKLLTKKEEMDLGKKIQKGKKLLSKKKLTAKDYLALQAAVAAIDKLVTQNVGLVVSIAQKFCGRGVELDDLIEEGYFGLLKAAEKFDPQRGTRFSTYATHLIRKTVNQATYDLGKTIRIPVHTSTKIRDFIRTQQRLLQELGREPSIPEIAAALGIHPKKITTVYLPALSIQPSSLDEPHKAHDPQSGPMGDFIPDTAPTPPQIAHENALRHAVQKAIASLKAPPEDTELLKYISGLLDGEEHTFEEAAKKFGVSNWEARKIKARLLRQLRHPRHARPLRDYLK